jgi:hypothetical protein
METYFSKIQTLFLPSQAVNFHRDSRNSRASPLLMAEFKIGQPLYDMNEAVPLHYSGCPDAQRPHRLSFCRSRRCSNDVRWNGHPYGAAIAG